MICNQNITASVHVHFLDRSVCLNSALGEPLLNVKITQEFG